MANGSTDPATVVSITQDPTKTPGWNIVTLSCPGSTELDGSVWKYAGVVERNERGIIVQRVALTDNTTGQIGPDGPIIDDKVRVMIVAAGGEVPPIHATVPVTPPPPAPIGIVTPPPASEPATVHLSWLQEIRAKLAEYEAWIHAHL